VYSIIILIEFWVQIAGRTGHAVAAAAVALVHTALVLETVGRIVHVQGIRNVMGKTEWMLHAGTVASSLIGSHVCVLMYKRTCLTRFPIWQYKGHTSSVIHNVICTKIFFFFVFCWFLPVYYDRFVSEVLNTVRLCLKVCLQRSFCSGLV
jgi:hypothetical protein